MRNLLRLPYKFLSNGKLVLFRASVVLFKISTLPLLPWFDSFSVYIPPHLTETFVTTITQLTAYALIFLLPARVQHMNLLTILTPLITFSFLVLS